MHDVRRLAGGVQGEVRVVAQLAGLRDGVEGEHGAARGLAQRGAHHHAPANKLYLGI